MPRKQLHLLLLLLPVNWPWNVAHYYSFAGGILYGMGGWASLSIQLNSIHPTRKEWRWCAEEMSASGSFRLSRARCSMQVPCPWLSRSISILFWYP
jgi:hypothetical protein